MRLIKVSTIEGIKKGQLPLSFFSCLFFSPSCKPFTVGSDNDGHNKRGEQGHPNEVNKSLHEGITSFRRLSYYTTIGSRYNCYTAEGYTVKGVASLATCCCTAPLTVYVISVHHKVKGDERA